MKLKIMLTSQIALWRHRWVSSRQEIWTTWIFQRVWLRYILDRLHIVRILSHVALQNFDTIYVDSGK